MDSQTPRRRSPTTKRIDWSKPASIVIDQRFGGLARFCLMTGFPTSTANGWRYAGFIPARMRNGDPCQAHILAVATQHEIAMDPADFVEKPANDIDSPAPPAGDSAAVPDLPPPAGAAAHSEVVDGQ